MSQENRVIVFTGGGTAGHVFPAFPVVARLRSAGYRVEWIGSRKGIEARLVSEFGLRYHSVPSGKLRRYFSFRNFTDFFCFLAGVLCSLVILARLRPRPVLVVSKGGFAGVGPVVAASLLGIPRVSHESDITPGLATRLNMAFGARMMVSYRRTMDFLPGRVARRAFVTGNPVRDEIISGDAGRLTEVLEVLRRDAEVVDEGSEASEDLHRQPGGLRGTPAEKGGVDRPIILVCGGSLGARKINKLVDESIERLLDFGFVIHQRGVADVEGSPRQGYVWAEFFSEEFAHILNAATVVVGRAGAGFVWEMAATGTPGVLLPLREGSRGDQVLNARAAAEAGFAVVMDENVHPAEFAEKLSALVADTGRLETMRAATRVYNAAGAADAFFKILKEYG